VKRLKSPSTSGEISKEAVLTSPRHSAPDSPRSVSPPNGNKVHVAIKNLLKVPYGVCQEHYFEI